MTKIFKKVSAVAIHTGSGVDLIIGKTSEKIGVHVQESYGMNIKQQSTPSYATTKISEGLQIIQREVGQQLAAQFDIFYNSKHSAEGGLIVSEPAKKYVVNHTLTAYIPSVFLTPADDPELVVQVVPVLNTLESDAHIVDARSFSFILPYNVSVPFKLSIF